MQAAAALSPAVQLGLGLLRFQTLLRRSAIRPIVSAHALPKNRPSALFRFSFVHQMRPCRARSLVGQVERGEEIEGGPRPFGICTGPRPVPRQPESLIVNSEKIKNE